MSVLSSALPTAFRLLARLPLARLHWLGALAGRLAYRFDRRYRNRLRANLRQALGDAADAAMMRQAAIEAGRQALELPWIWQRPVAEVLASVREVRGVELLDAAQASGRGLLLVTPHLGCFEVIAPYCGSRFPMTCLYRPPRLAALDPLMRAGRERGDTRIVPADVSGVRALMRALKRGEAVGLLPDQVPRAGEGIWAPFFGRPAFTMTLAARLSAVSGVETLMIWARRLPEAGGYVIEVSRPLSPLSGDTTARCHQLNAEIEALIRRAPAQYLWGYNRYKQPARSPAPEPAP